MDEKQQLRAIVNACETTIRITQKMEKSGKAELIAELNDWRRSAYYDSGVACLKLQDKESAIACFEKAKTFSGVDNILAELRRKDEISDSQLRLGFLTKGTLARYKIFNADHDEYDSPKYYSLRRCNSEPGFARGQTELGVHYPRAFVK